MLLSSAEGFSKDKVSFHQFGLEWEKRDPTAVRAEFQLALEGLETWVLLMKSNCLNIHTLALWVNVSAKSDSTWLNEY